MNGITMGGARRRRSGSAVRRIFLAALPVIAALPLRDARAATVYWDINGATAGAGGATPANTWGGTALWSSSSAGTAATAVWTGGDTAVFSAGADATGAFTVGVNGTQTVGGVTFEEGAVTLSNVSSGALSLSGAAAFNVQPALATINVPLVGAGSLTKSGAGALVLGVANSYSGGTTLSAGTLQLNNTASLGTGNVTLGGGTLLHNFTDPFWHSGKTVTLTSPSTIGVTPGNQVNLWGTLNGGGNALTVGGGGLFFLGEPGSTVSNVASIDVTGNTTMGSDSNAAGWGGAGTSITVQHGSSLGILGVTMPNPITLFGTPSGSGALFAYTPGGFSGALTLSNIHSLTVGIGGSSNFAISGAVGGAGGLTKLGSSTITLSGANTFTGIVNINAGTLAVSGGNALPNSNSVTLANVSGASLSVSGAEQIGNLSGGGASGGNVVINAASSLAVNSTGTTTYAGVISGAGALGKVGAGTLVLTGGNTYSGGTTVSGGTLQANSASVLGSGNITLNGATLLHNFTTTSWHSGKTVTLTAGSGIGVTPGNQVKFHGTLNGGGIYSLTVNGGGTFFLGQPGSTVSGLDTILVTGNSIMGSDANAAGWGGSAGFPGSGPLVHVVAGSSLGINAAPFMPNPLTLNGTTSAQGALFAYTAGGGFTGPITLQSTTSIGGANDFVIAGNISGAGGLTKVGSSTVTLYANGSYAGTTTVSAGALNLQHGSTLGSGAVTLAGGQLIHDFNGTMYSGRTVTMTAASGLSVTSGKQVNFEGTLTGGGNVLTVGGGGTLYLGQPGASVNNVASIQVTGNSSLGTATSLGLGGASTPIHVASGSSVQMFNQPSVPNPLFLNGTTTGNGALFIASPLGGEWTGPVTLNATSGIGGTQFFAITGNISGPGGLIKLGAGFTRIMGNNSYAGATTINAGTLDATGGSAIPDGSVVTLANVAGAGLLVWPNPAVSETIGGLTGGGAAGGNVDIPNANTTLIVAQASNAIFAGSIVGLGGLTKTGAASLTLSGSNTFTGPLTINAGTLLVSGGNAIPNGVPVTIANAPGATLVVSGVEQIGNLSGGGASGGNVVLDVASALQVTSSGTTTYAGAISGAGTLTKLGAGTLVLTGANTFSGGTTVSGGGTLRLGANNAAGTGSLQVAGATFDLNGFNQTATNLAVGDGVATAGATISGAGTLTLNGDITFHGAPGNTTAAATLASNVSLSAGNHTITNVGSVFSNQTYDLVVTGVISGPGGITKAGGTPSYFVALTQSNTYLGPTAVNSGSLFLAATNAIPSSSAVTVNAGAILRLNPGNPQSGVTPGNYNQSIGSLSGGGSVVLGSATLTVGSNNDSTSFAGTITGTAGSLTKVGAGTLTLSGNNTYSGTTTVSGGGTLRLGANNAAGTGALRVAGATFDLNGFNQTATNLTVGDGVATAGATVSGAGTLTLNGDITFHGAPGNTTAAATLASNVSLAAGNHTFANVGSAFSSQSYDLVANGVLSGSGGITVGGSFFFVALTQSNNYLGATNVIDSGRLFLATTNAVPASSPVTVNSGAILILNPSSSHPGVTPGNYNQSIGSLSGGGSVNLGSATLTVGNDNNSTSFSGSIAGSGGSVSKVGFGTLTLSGSGTYTGATTISEGAIQMDQAGALGGGNVTLSGGALLHNFTDFFMYAGRTITMTAPAGVGVSAGNQVNFAGTLNGGGNGLSLFGDGTFYLGQPTSTVTNLASIELADPWFASLGSDSNSAGWGGTAGVPGSGPTVTLNPGTSAQIFNNVTMPNPMVVIDATVFKAGGAAGGGFSGPILLLGFSNNFGGDHDFTVSGVVSGANNFIKSGTSTVTLSGANTYGGVTNIDAGTLNAVGGTALPNGTLVNLADVAGATLRIASGTEVIGGLAGGGTTGGEVTLVGGAVLSVNQSGNSTFAGVISGAGGLAKAGTNTLTLSGDSNTYSGGTTVSAGALRINHPSGAGSGNITLGGGTLLHNHTDVFAHSGRTLTLTAASALGVPPANQINFWGTLNGGGNALTVNGGGTFFLGEPGSTVSNISSIDVAGNTTMGSDGNAAGWGGAGTGVTVQNGSSLGILGVTMPNAITLFGTTGGNGALFAYTSGGGFSGAVTLASTSGVGGGGDFTISGDISGAAGLTKLGTSTITLSGTNTYTGATTADAGTLVIANSLTTSSSVTAANDAVIELAAGGGNMRVIVTPNVSIAGTGKLDLKDNKLITNVALGSATEGVYGGLQGEVQRAMNFGSWDAPGLTTSMQLALDGIATVGVATGEQIRGLGPTDTDVWAGQTINGASTIAMYTYAGDANLDGQVDAGDYGILDAFIQMPGATGYGNGDFNYDGFIDAADYGTIDNSIQFQGPPIATGGSAVALAGVTAVPEPATLSVLGLAVATLVSRRRRRRDW